MPVPLLSEPQPRSAAPNVDLCVRRHADLQVLSVTIVCNSDGQLITEYLPEDHDGRRAYGLVKDPTPEKGRPLRAMAAEREQERRERHS